MKKIGSLESSEGPVPWHTDSYRKSRIRIFHSVIESILLYDSETWTLTKQMTLRLDGCYAKLLSYIQNIKYNPDAEHHASNAEVYWNDVCPVLMVQRNASHLVDIV
jgi:hypothetical protein